MTSLSFQENVIKTISCYWWKEDEGGEGRITAYQIKTFSLSINITLPGFQISPPFLWSVIKPEILILKRKRCLSGKATAKEYGLFNV